MSVKTIQYDYRLLSSLYVIWNCSAASRIIPQCCRATSGRPSLWGNSIPHNTNAVSSRKRGSQVTSALRGIIYKSRKRPAWILKPYLQWHHPVGNLCIFANWRASGSYALDRLQECVYQRCIPTSGLRKLSEPEKQVHNRQLPFGNLSE